MWSCIGHGKDRESTEINAQLNAQNIESGNQNLILGED